MTIAIYKHEWNDNDDYNCHQCNLVAVCPSVKSAQAYIKTHQESSYLGKDGNTYPYYVLADWRTKERIEL